MSSKKRMPVVKKPGEGSFITSSYLQQQFDALNNINKK